MPGHSAASVNSYGAAVIAVRQSYFGELPGTGQLKGSPLFSNVCALSTLLSYGVIWRTGKKGKKFEVVRRIGEVREIQMANEFGERMEMAERPGSDAPKMVF